MSIYAEATITVSAEVAKKVADMLAQRLTGQTNVPVGRWVDIPDSVIGEQEKVDSMFRWNASGNKLDYDLHARTGSRFGLGKSKQMVSELTPRLNDWFMTNCHGYLAKEAAVKEGYRVTENWDAVTHTPVLMCEGGETVGGSSIPDFAV